MRLIPAGSFTMGREGGQRDESPAHEVRVTEFWMDETEVTNSQYRQFATATGRELPLRLRDGVAEVRVVGENRGGDEATVSIEVETDTGTSSAVGVIDPGSNAASAVAEIAADLRSRAGCGVVNNQAWPLVVLTGCRRVRASVAGGEGLAIELRGRAAGPDRAATFEDEPVIDVSWDDAAAFCQWLTAQRSDGFVYRLPTEAEWEYTCLTGKETKGLGRTVGPSQATASPSNILGIRGMVDNVAEFCLDFYADNYYGRSPPTDPRGPEHGEDRVVRGSDWSTPRTWNIVCVNREYLEPGTRNHPTVGFRVVRSRLHGWK